MIFHELCKRFRQNPLAGGRATNILDSPRIKPRASLCIFSSLLTYVSTIHSNTDCRMWINPYQVLGTTFETLYHHALSRCHSSRSHHFLNVRISLYSVIKCRSRVLTQYKPIRDRFITYQGDCSCHLKSVF